MPNFVRVERFEVRANWAKTTSHIDLNVDNILYVEPAFYFRDVARVKMVGGFELDIPVQNKDYESILGALSLKETRKG